MQATLLPLSPSLSLYKSRTSHLSIFKSNNTFLSSFKSCTPLTSSKFISLTPLHHSSHRLHTKATTTAAADDSSDSTSLIKTLELGALFCLWFSFNIYFNIYNKQVLKVYHFPVTLTLFQFAVGTLIVSFMWGLHLYKRPKITSSQVFFYSHSSAFSICHVTLLFYLFSILIGCYVICWLFAAFSNISIGFGTYIREPFH